MLALDIVGPAERLDDLRRDLTTLFRPLHIGLDDRELITANPRNEVRRQQRLDQARANDFQQLIADRVAKAVVHGLKVVEIDTVNRKSTAWLELRKRRFEMLSEQDAVGQIRQHIVARQMCDPGF